MDILTLGWAGLMTMFTFSLALVVWASLRLRIFCLTLHGIVTRRFILQKARHHPLTGS